MNTLRESLTDYLAMRRALGFKLRGAANALRSFVLFLENQGAAYVTTRLALEWAQHPPSAQRATWAGRLRYVRGFAKYQSAFDVRTEVPPCTLLPGRPRRARPYIYNETEIQQLLEAALHLPSNSALKNRTYYCLFGLLAVSGLRISEALGLKANDVDFSAGLLTVEGSKFGKSRLVPLHASTREVLAGYMLSRDQILNGRTACHLFVNLRGKQLSDSTVRRTFKLLCQQIGLRQSLTGPGPRLHDFRHRFAFETLLRWYRSGENVERRLPTLSTFLGHVNPSDTYWYLTAHPELMGAVVARFEKHWGMQ